MSDGGEEVVKSKIVATLHKGDRIVVATAGGGGYGPPLERDAALLLADLRNGKVSLEAARNGLRIPRQCLSLTICMMRRCATARCVRRVGGTI